MPESVYKVIELVGTSTESWEKAATAAVERAAKTLRDLRVAEIAQLDEADRREFLAELGFEESGLDQVIRAGYGLLELLTFFTAGPKEVRAWTVRTGSTAPQAAAAEAALESTDRFDRVLLLRLNRPEPVVAVIGAP